jgi:DNA-binding NtrC family response regulator
MSQTDTPVLLIEDTSSLQLIYASLLREAGWKVETASTAAEALKKFDEISPNIVLLDLMLPDLDGLEVMRSCLKKAPNTRFVVITADGSIDRAVEAMRAGAHEFLVKPLDEGRLAPVVSDAARAASAMASEANFDASIREQDTLIAHSPNMRTLFTELRAVSNSKATVFLTGESGSGRRSIARAIHQMSPRASGPLVVINCGALRGSQLEEELFGIPASCDTQPETPGAAERADGGTLILQDVGALSPEGQSKLLRFVQIATSASPAGSGTRSHADVRLIATCNFDPMLDEKPNRIMDELFYLLYVVPFRIPPLRERGEDIIEIARTLLRECCDEEGGAFKDFSTGARDILLSYDWPGNIRQLRNVLRRIVLLNDATTVTAAMLPPELSATPVGGSQASANPMQSLVGQTLAEIERHVIEETIRKTSGSLPRAARILGVAPSTLYRKRENWTDSREDQSQPSG